MSIILFLGCFECICGEFCDIESYKRKFKKNNCVLVKSRKNGFIDSETDIDSDNTIEDQSDTDFKEFDEPNDKTFNENKDEINDNNMNETKEHNLDGTENHENINNISKAEEMRIKREIIKKSKRKSKRKKYELKPLVQCRSCGSYQHSVCVNFDIDKRRPYYCGHCWVRDGMKPLDSRATLIVSPRSISHQWQDEITKHVDCSKLSIFFYEGVKGNKGL